MKQILKNNYLNDLAYAFITAITFSAFIYFEDFGIINYFLNTFLTLIGIYLLLHVNKRTLFFSGFLIGIFWFYWISYSFKYNGVGYIAPFIVVGFGIIYSLFFGILAFSDKPYIRAIILFGLSFFTPMDFNWMQIPLGFTDSYIGIYKWQFAIVLIALSLGSLIKEKRYKNLPLLLLIFAINWGGYPTQKEAPLKIKLIQTDVRQEEKWTKEALKPTILMVYDKILQAKKEGFDVVVLPESVVPLFLNKYPILIEQFQKLSKDIDIILGSLYLENNKHYNVTYHFYNGKDYEIAKKYVLVPFGEYIPLPAFIKDFVNETFFAGASDFVTAKKPSNLHVKGIDFRNAICYEATTDRLFYDNPSYMIAISNNGWFAPSIEPTLQKILMKYYAKKYGTVIYHSANYKGTGVIKP